MSYVEKTLKAGKGYEEIIPINWELYKELYEEFGKETPAPVVTMGVPFFDNLLEGFEGGRLYVISGPTKSGKTTFAQTVMFQMAKLGIPSGFFSYEMGPKEVVAKFAAADGLTGWKGKPTNLPLFMPTRLHTGGGDLHFAWLFDAIKKGRDEHGIKLFVIDHLHFLLPLKSYDNTSFLLGGIVRELKKMSVMLNVPIILLAHMQKLDDEFERPTWMHIRDSSFITQEADVTLMVYRVKDKAKARKEIERKGKAQTNEPGADYNTKCAILSVELNRMSGNTGFVKMWHNGSIFVPYNGQDQYV